MEKGKNNRKMLQKEMRNYKTNFTEVDEILFVPKRNKKGQKKSTKANVLIPLSKLCSTFHDSTCHLVCIFLFLNSLLRLSFLTSTFLICECLPFGFPLFSLSLTVFLIRFYFISLSLVRIISHLYFYVIKVESNMFNIV